MSRCSWCSGADSAELETLWLQQWWESWRHGFWAPGLGIQVSGDLINGEAREGRGLVKEGQTVCSGLNLLRWCFPEAEAGAWGAGERWGFRYRNIAVQRRLQPRGTWRIFLWEREDWGEVFEEVEEEFGKTNILTKAEERASKKSASYEISGEVRLKRDRWCVGYWWPYSDSKKKKPEGKVNAKLLEPNNYALLNREGNTKGRHWSRLTMWFFHDTPKLVIFFSLF